MAGLRADSGLPACSAEASPQYSADVCLVIGTYLNEEDELGGGAAPADVPGDADAEADADADADAPGTDADATTATSESRKAQLARQNRNGALLLYAAPAAALAAHGASGSPSAWGALPHAQRLEVPAVFDVKWCPREVAMLSPAAAPLLVAACADCSLRFVRCADGQLTEVGSVTEGGDTVGGGGAMALAVDWNNRLLDAAPKLCSAYSDGGVAVWALESALQGAGAGAEAEMRWQAHDMEPWVHTYADPCCEFLK